MKRCLLLLLALLLFASLACGIGQPTAIPTPTAEAGVEPATDTPEPASEDVAPEDTPRPEETAAATETATATATATATITPTATLGSGVPAPTLGVPTIPPDIATLIPTLPPDLIPTLPPGVPTLPSNLPNSNLP